MDYTSYEVWVFDLETGHYTEEGIGDCSQKCPNCHADLSDVFQEGPVNYDARESTPES
jgi:hypothetical protein